MVKIILINLNYLEQIIPIKDYLRDTPKTEKSIKTYLHALNKFFPYLVNRFKESIVELKDFNLNAYYNLNTIERNKTKENWLKNNIHNKIMNDWMKLSPEKKSNILMKFVNDSSENNETTERNTYLNYAWIVQGLLSKLGRDYEANPKTMEQLKRNGTKIGSEIDYEDVIELYDKLNNDKYKLILKIMMYAGLNPIDILDLKPKDFIKVDSKAVKIILDRKYYYVKKERIKTKRKNVEFLLVFAENFFNELKNYFERKIIIQIDKSKKEKIETLKNDTHFTIENKTDNYIKFKGQYNWEKDNKDKIFGNIKPNTVSDTLKYYVEKYNLNSELKPMTIRSLCFTLLKKIFPLEDKPIWDLWTQHKIKGITDQFYITNYLEKTIENYIKKIETLVLIGNLREISLKVNGYKEKVDKIYTLEKENKELRQELNELKGKIEEEIIPALEDFATMKNELYNLRMFEDEKELINKIAKSTGKSYEEAKKTLLRYRLSQKDITDKEIIEFFGMKETPKKPSKKLKIGLEKVEKKLKN